MTRKLDQADVDAVLERQIGSERWGAMHETQKRFLRESEEGTLNAAIALGWTPPAKPGESADYETAPVDSKFRYLDGQIEALRYVLEHECGQAIESRLKDTVATAVDVIRKLTAERDRAQKSANAWAVDCAKVMGQRENLEDILIRHDLRAEAAQVLNMPIDWINGTGEEVTPDAH